MHLRSRRPGGELIEMSQAQKCKRLHAEGMSIRRIASTLKMARNTVRRYVRGEQVPGQYQLRAGRPQPAREQVRGRVHELLAQEREKETPKKQRLTAARIHRILEGEGSTASERTVRSAVSEVRVEMRDLWRTPTPRLGTRPPGTPAATTVATTARSSPTLRRSPAWSRPPARISQKSTGNGRRRVRVRSRHPRLRTARAALTRFRPLWS